MAECLFHYDIEERYNADPAAAECASSKVNIERRHCQSESEVEHDPVPSGDQVQQCFCENNAAWTLNDNTSTDGNVKTINSQ